jgi:hypothetical protein
VATKPRSPLPSAPLLVLCAGAAFGCKPDNELKAIVIENTAVITGDFDRVEESLARNSVKHDLFEGYISNAIYEEDVDPSIMNPKVEALWRSTNEDGNPLTADYDAIFVNSGSRGLGEYVYNGVDTDDDFLSDPAIDKAMFEFHIRGGVLVVSDWGYDLVESLWPDKISFLDEGDGFDAAQAGLDDSITAEVTDPELARNANSDFLDLQFDYSHWTVMRGVSSDVNVHLTGDVTYRDSLGQGAQTLTDVPLLVSFPVEQGRVIVSSFAWKAQNPGVTDVLLATLLAEMQVEVIADQTAEVTQ